MEEGLPLSKEGELKQKLGLFDATAINVGAIIGGGVDRVRTRRSLIPPHKIEE